MFKKITTKYNILYNKYIILSHKYRYHIYIVKIVLKILFMFSIYFFFSNSFILEGIPTLLILCIQFSVVIFLILSITNRSSYIVLKYINIYYNVLVVFLIIFFIYINFKTMSPSYDYDPVLIKNSLIYVVKIFTSEDLEIMSKLISKSLNYKLKDSDIVFIKDNYKNFSEIKKYIIEQISILELENENKSYGKFFSDHRFLILGAIVVAGILTACVYTYFTGDTTASAVSSLVESAAVVSPSGDTTASAASSLVESIAPASSSVESELADVILPPHLFEDAVEKAEFFCKQIAIRRSAIYSVYNNMIDASVYVENGFGLIGSDLREICQRNLSRCFIPSPEVCNAMPKIIREFYEASFINYEAMATPPYLSSDMASTLFRISPWKVAEIFDPNSLSYVDDQLDRAFGLDTQVKFRDPISNAYNILNCVPNILKTDEEWSIFYLWQKYGTDLSGKTDFMSDAVAEKFFKKSTNTIDIVGLIETLNFKIIHLFTINQTDCIKREVMFTSLLNLDYKKKPTLLELFEFFRDPDH